MYMRNCLGEPFPCESCDCSLPSGRPTCEGTDGAGSGQVISSPPSYQVLHIFCGCTRCCRHFSGTDETSGEKWVRRACVWERSSRRARSPSRLHLLADFCDATQAISPPGSEREGADSSRWEDFLDQRKKLATGRKKLIKRFNSGHGAA